MREEIQTVDARGLSCPQPVMVASKVLKKIEKGRVQVLVDSGTALDNVSRFARSSGWAVTVEPQPDGSSRIVLQK